MTEVYGIGPQHVAEVWPAAAALLGPAVERDSGRMSVFDIWNMATEGLVKLWIAVDDAREIIGVAVARPVQYPAKKGLFVMFIGGHDREKWQARMMEVIEEGAAHIGCDLVEGIGRKGFERVLPGYRLSGFVYEKDLRA